MILPDYERSDSPELYLDGRDHSPVTMWKNGHDASGPSGYGQYNMMVAAANNPGNGNRGHGNNGNNENDHPYGPTGPITPTTPIIYGNGTMLSDIGEVTEAESTPGKPSPSRIRGYARMLESPTSRANAIDAALRSSPTMGAAALIIQRSRQSLISQRERRSSTDSTSTITTTEDRARLFIDFDDTVSVGDSVFQGDDEESMASSYVEGTAPAPRTDSRLLAAPRIENLNLDRLSTYSTTSLSRKADEILANAKKRLTTMEGNLTRARSSLHVTAPTYGSDASTPSPPFQRATTSHGREHGQSSPTGGHSPGHSRISSDIAMRNGLPYRVSSAQRSQMRESDDKATVRADELPDGSSQGAKRDSFLSPTFGAALSDTSSCSGKGVQKSASVAQMRDIKGQMKDLKGKISNLREQARNDSIKRQSLQSLRTPSPFTNSQIDQWCVDAPSNRSSSSDMGAGKKEASAGKSPWDGDESSVDGDRRKNPHNGNESAADEAVNTTKLRQASEHLKRQSIPLPILTQPDVGKAEIEDDEDDGISDMLTEDGEEEDLQSIIGDAVTDIDYDSESGESLYHDTVQHPISHEDREDAFDYEHFFLHSAMGTMSQQRMGRRGSNASHTSEESMETTRGPIVTKQGRRAANGSEAEGSSNIRPGSVTRRNSSASVSTVETFATAEEGRPRRSEERSRDSDILSEGLFGTYPSQIHSISNTRRSESAGKIKMSSSHGSGMGGGVRTADHPTMSSSKSTSTMRDSDGSPSSIPEEGSDAANQQQQHHRHHRGVSSSSRPPMSSSAPASMHRPSVSSFVSTGTTRSFPLVNIRGVIAGTAAAGAGGTGRRTSTGILTPTSASPDQELKNMSDTPMEDTASMCEQPKMRGSSSLNNHNHNRNDNDNYEDDSSDDRGAGSSGRFSEDTSPTSVPPPALQTLVLDDKFLVERLVAGLGRCVLGLSESGRASAESRMYRRRIDAARRILEGTEPL
ncbi:hypothetical protein B0T17DRAFT_647766 [Bombardia bombarda]|uniref:Uncharacterized protein n=1 Tax=Bombardia bombarda TaxID=252184 RepID=A0AA39TQ62_9PEZI|nr:hypothetical protein B0T17DRAFT_647766 [Bombardia bombarda]